MEVRDATPAWVGEMERLRDALRRLASAETFTTALDLEHSSRDAIADELRARMRYAEEAVTARG